jgi:hypothetical protein
MEEAKLGPHPRIKATENNVHNYLKLSDLNGIDRAGQQDELDVGCSIYLMVLMVSDVGVSRAQGGLGVCGGGGGNREGKGPRCEDIVSQCEVFCINSLQQITVYFFLSMYKFFFLLALSVKDFVTELLGYFVPSVI